MDAAQAIRPRLATLDYSQREEETELVVPLLRVRRARPRPRALSQPSLLHAKPRTPLIVDKHQLVQIMTVVCKAPPRVKPRVRRLSELVIAARTAAHRQQRHRVWLTRIGLVAVMELATFMATRL